MWFYIINSFAESFWYVWKAKLSPTDKLSDFHFWSKVEPISQCTFHLVDMMKCQSHRSQYCTEKLTRKALGRLELPNWRFSEGGWEWGRGHFQLRKNKNGKTLFLDFDLSLQHIYLTLNRYSKVSAFSSASQPPKINCDSFVVRKSSSKPWRLKDFSVLSFT